MQENKQIIPDHLQIQISHHGDSVNRKFMAGLPKDTESILQQLSAPVKNASELQTQIVICHSEPGAWHPANYHTKQCPPQEFFTKPQNYTKYYKIGRTVC